MPDGSRFVLVSISRGAWGDKQWAISVRSLHASAYKNAVNHWQVRGLGRDDNLSVSCTTA